jgi:hypothetical protein
MDIKKLIECLNNINFKKPKKKFYSQALNLDFLHEERISSKEYCRNFKK